MIVIKLEMENKERQMLKIAEEFIELIKEHIASSSTAEQKLSEAWDLIQSTLGYMHIISSDVEIEDSYKKHLNKIENRAVSGSIVIEDYYEI